MLHEIQSFFKRKLRRTNDSIDPEDIFLDSQNLPEFDEDQFEGRMEKPISRQVATAIGAFIFCICAVFVWKLWSLEVVQGERFRERSESNSLQETTIYADRGLLYDRAGAPIVWNAVNPATSDYSLRVYATSTGLSTVLGYVKYPSKDSSGFYYLDKFDPKDGLEKLLDSTLSGKNGINIVETDVKGNVVSESVTQKPVDGENVDLSVDLGLQRELYKSLLDLRDRAGFKGGAGVIMDVHTGEILASSNFPEYDSQVMTDGDDTALISSWINSGDHPFLNRVVQGLYTPGSIMKLFVAMGVLDQHVIDPEKQILSTGSISIPNPYYPDKPSVFMDWKAHGLVDLRRALAVSSNVYFYEVTGGYKDQKGIGIDNIEKYTRLFGFGSTTGIDFPGEKAGVIPDPAWKAANFDGEEWRLGDTYNTAIGQYGFQATPIQAVRAVAAIANGGKLLTPTFLKMEGGRIPQIDGTVDLDPDYFEIVKEGMREGVNGGGTSAALDFPFLEVASKTGTAQLGVSKDEVNSWVVGYWPYEDPKYAYAIVMERGSKTNQFGAVLVMQEFLDWMHVYEPQYLQ
jgi:penicillin-binding protein 2